MSTTAIGLPSSWPATGELARLTTARCARTRSQLRALRETEPHVDGWLEAAAIAERDMPLRDSEPHVEREKCDGCARCSPKTVRKRWRRHG